MASRFPWASALVKWFRESAARSPIQFLQSISELWYSENTHSWIIFDSVNEYVHKPLPKGATLMSLPTEIRSMILSPLLISETIVRPYELTTPISTPTILQVCKQLNIEGAHLLYTQNVFQLDEPILAIQFLSWDYRVSRSMIREITIYFSVDGFQPNPIQDPEVGYLTVANLVRQNHLPPDDHPAQDHVALGYQPSYRVLRTLAASMHQWSVALSNVPPGIRDITIIPYCFYNCCNHIQQAWPLGSIWFCHGCGLQQFCTDNKLEDFLPTAVIRQIHWEQGPQMVVAYEPDFNRKLSHRQLRVRQAHLFEVATGSIGRIANGP